MKLFDAVWARLVRVVTFLGGMGIMGYETLADKSDRPWLYAAAIGMMGLPIANEAEKVIARFVPGGPTITPPGPEPPTTTVPTVQGSGTENTR